MFSWSICSTTIWPLTFFLEFECKCLETFYVFLWLCLVFLSELSSFSLEHDSLSLIEEIFGELLECLPLSSVLYVFCMFYLLEYHLQYLELVYNFWDYLIIGWCLGIFCKLFVLPDGKTVISF